MAEEWGPWIEHDGKDCPRPSGLRIQVQYTGDGIPPPLGTIPNDLPNFFWRMKRVWTGFLSWETRRVCHDRAYAPIVRYRVRRPSAVSASRALEQLREIAANPSAPLPKRRPERVLP